MLAFDVKDGTGGDGDVQHFFQTHGLSAELDFVIVPASFFAAFEVDRIRNIEHGRIVVSSKFHKIGFASHAESIRHQHHAGNVSLVASFEIRGVIDFPMSVFAFGSVLVVLPDLFDEMQRQPPFTEQQVVQISQRQKIVFSKW